MKYDNGDDSTTKTNSDDDDNDNDDDDNDNDDDDDNDNDDATTRNFFAKAAKANNDERRTTNDERSNERTTKSHFSEYVQYTVVRTQVQRQMVKKNLWLRFESLRIFFARARGKRSSSEAGTMCALNHSITHSK